MASGTDRRPGHLGTGAETPPPAPSVVPPDRRVVARRYELGRELGAGSYGRVWFARDLVGQRDVALKRLRSDQAGDAIVRRRLWREARAVARLEHPAIVRLFDYGEDESREPYVVMELVDGESLARAAARCNSASVLGGWLDQLLDALAYAHARGVVHRDLKPQNVLLCHLTAAAIADSSPTQAPDSPPMQASRRIKVLDFGLARVEEDPDMNITGTSGETVGTPIYMAPEQATQQSLVGPASDLYAVGIMAWEMFCGAPPFMGANATATVLQHVRAPLPPFQPRPGVEAPAALGPALARALEKDPRRRYPDAAAMRRALRQVFEACEEDFDETLVSVVPTGFGSDASGAATLNRLASERSFAPRGTATRVVEAPLTGREAWQRALWSKVGEVSTRQRPAMIVLDGEPGVGKHRLGRWLVETANQTGYLTVLDLGTNAGDVRASDPLGISLRAALGLGPAAPADPTGAVTEALAAIGAEHAVDAGPLAERFWSSTGSGRPRRSFALFDLLRHLTSRRPVLLWIGRWHSASRLARRMMLDVIERAFEQGLALLVVATVDDGALPEEAHALLSRWPAQIERLVLPPLPPSATWTLLSRHLPDDPAHLPYQAEIQGIAAGNPLKAAQLAHLLWECGAVSHTEADLRWSPPLPRVPHGMRTVLTERIDGLFARDPEMMGDDLRRLSTALAVLGQTFSVPLAERLATRQGQSTRAAAGLVERLVDAGLLAEFGKDGLSFAHPLFRTHLLDTLDSGERQRAHHHCADMLLATLGASIEAVAEHLVGAGQAARARELLANAAEDALRLGDIVTAEAILAAAMVGLPPEADAAQAAVRERLWVLRGRLSLERGRPEETLSLLAVLPAPPNDDVADARLRLQAEALTALGDAVAAEPLLQTALARAEADPAAPGSAVPRLRWLLGRCHLSRGRIREARGLLIAARGELAAQGEPVAELRARLDLSQLAESAGDAAAALRFAQDAAALRGDAADSPLTAEAALRAADILRRTGQQAEARDAFALALRRFESRGHLAGQAKASKGLAQMERVLGDHAESRTAYERARAAYAAIGDALQAGQCDMHLGWIHTRAGELDRAEGCFLRALTALQGSEDALRTGLLYGFLARLAHYRGDRDQRQRRLAEAMRLDAGRCLAVPEWPRTLEVLADALVREGDPDQAATLLTRAAEVWRILRSADDETRCRRGARELSGA
jgi:serine/threonine protein kinase/tetratricopeptide (TPR) repeat protein